MLKKLLSVVGLLGLLWISPGFAQVIPGDVISSIIQNPPTLNSSPTWTGAHTFTQPVGMGGAPSSPAALTLFSTASTALRFKAPVAPWDIFVEPGVFSGVPDEVLRVGYNTDGAALQQPKWSENVEPRYEDCPLNPCLEKHWNYTSIDRLVSNRPFEFSLNLDTHESTVSWNIGGVFAVKSKDAGVTGFTTNGWTGATHVFGTFQADGPATMSTINGFSLSNGSFGPAATPLTLLAANGAGTATVPRVLIGGESPAGVGLLTTVSDNPMSAGATTVNVVSTSEYPSSGTLLIGTEAVSYTGKTATAFTGLTRGVFGTTAASHVTGTQIDHYNMLVYSNNALANFAVLSSGAVGMLGITPAPGVVDLGASGNGYRLRINSSGANSWVNIVSTQGSWLVGMGTDASTNQFALRDQGQGLTRLLINATGDLIVNNGEGATPAAGKLRGPAATGTNINGASLTLQPSLGTGTGTRGTLVVSAAAAAQASGTTAHTAVSHMTIGDGKIVYAQNVLNLLPTSETIAGGGTITADACGGNKRITSASAVTTNTTDTFTAPSANNAGCMMQVCNANATDAITLDKNANTLLVGGADVVLAAGCCVDVVSTGAGGVWKQTTAQLCSS
jgi:hypothetical protein